MISCWELQRISLRLTKIFQAPDLPFGGINLIFAGDFAQLPPPFRGVGSALYSGDVGLKATTAEGQKGASGKALWHQVTTVVLLRKNMRQIGSSIRNQRFRTALANMRYKACTQDDIDILSTCCHSNGKHGPKIYDSRFRNVSIITALNICKDRINELGSIRFASETNQHRHTFYSNDTLSLGKKTAQKKKAYNGQLTEKIQEMLWDMYPTFTDNIPGKLELCFGLPVMIRHNFATELCITKGQEGEVYGWTYKLGNRNQKILDTLFVKLVNPPQNVQFDHLPPNVVPVPSTTSTIDCLLKNDAHISITRVQVAIVPNFAMTDYASQGKTRASNVVHLNNCRNHQSIYTALSRGTSIEGTLIMDGLNVKKITGGCTGSLRQ
ncbi:hypothetical protein BDN72DRAFT_774602, partial [Pluteus cervinus]